jgi:hypothetical protein
MNNGQGSATTESGAYDMTASVPLLMKCPI